MARKTLFNTEFATLSGLKDNYNRVIKYLMDNRNCYVNSSLLRNVFQVTTMLPTPVNVIFDHLKNTDKLDIFAPIHLDKGVIPEVLTTDDIVIDLTQLDGHILKQYPEFFNKILINLSSILKISKVNQAYSVSDINVMHAMYTRGALIASYQDSDGWLNPTLNVFIVKTYSMIISRLLALQYNLTYFEQLNIAAVFALYMCQALGAENDNLDNPSLFQRCTFLSDKRSTLNDLAKAMSHLSSTGLNIGKVCLLIKELGPPRMETFNPQILYRTISSLGTSAISMSIALEYPPYWVYQLLLAVGNTKIKMLYELKNNKLFDDCKAFAHVLNTSNCFVEQLHR